MYTIDLLLKSLKIRRKMKNGDTIDGGTVERGV